MVTVCNNKTEVPLAGCESHRLQLGVYDKLGPEEKKRGINIVQEASIENQALSKVDKLMGELNTIKNAAILCGGLTDEEGDIKPERRTRAKWASSFKILVKYENFAQLSLESVMDFLFLFKNLFLRLKREVY